MRKKLEYMKNIWNFEWSFKDVNFQKRLWVHMHWFLASSQILQLCSREQYFGFVPFFVFFSYAADLSLFLETGKGLTCAVFTESVNLSPDWWTWHYILESSAELLPGAKKDGFLLVHEPEPMVCEVKWSYIAYVREEYLKLCSQAFVSSNHVSAFEWKALF